MLRAYNPPEFNTPLIWGDEANEEYQTIVNELINRNTITRGAINRRLRSEGITPEIEGYEDLRQIIIDEEERLIVVKKFLRHDNFNWNIQTKCHDEPNCTFLKEIRFPYSQRGRSITKINAFSPRPRGSSTMSPGFICITHSNQPQKVYIAQSDLEIEVASLFCFCTLSQINPEVFYSMEENLN